MINWLYSAKRLLMAHSDAMKGLDTEIVLKIYEYLFDDFRSWIDGERVNGFGATLHVFLQIGSSSCVFLGSDK